MEQEIPEGAEISKVHHLETSNTILQGVRRSSIRGEVQLNRGEA